MAVIPRATIQSRGIQADRPRTIPSARGLARGFDVLAQVASEEQDRRDRLTLNAANNRIRNKLLEDYTDRQINIKKQEAVDLTRREADRLKEERDDFLESVPEHLRDQSIQIYNNASLSYLRQIGSHEMSEMESWERDEMAETNNTYNRLAVSNEVGDMESLENQLREVTDIFVEGFDNPQAAEATRKEMMISAFQTWASLNPTKTQQILNENAGKIKRVMGDDYNSVLSAVRQGVNLHRAEEEYNYKLAKRQESERQEFTLRDGLALYIDPGQQLTPAWILGEYEKGNLTASGMNTLRTLMSVQNESNRIDETNVDWMDFYRLADLANNYAKYGKDRDESASLIASSINRSITDKMGQSLLNVIAKDIQLTDEQQLTLDRIDKSQFRNNTNEDARTKSVLKGRFYRSLMEQGVKWNPEIFNSTIDDQFDIDAAAEMREELETTYTGPVEALEGVLPTPQGPQYYQVVTTPEERNQVEKLVQEFLSTYRDYPRDRLDALRWDLLRNIVRAGP